MSFMDWWAIESSRGRKISSFPDFEGKGVLIEAQEIGIRLTGGAKLDATSITLIGLTHMLVKSGALKDVAMGWEK